MHTVRTPIDNKHVPERNVYDRVLSGVHLHILLLNILILFYVGTFREVVFFSFLHFMVFTSGDAVDAIYDSPE